MQNNCRSHYLVTIDIGGANYSQRDNVENEKKVYNHETY